jgi:hypothetical protein
MKIFNGSSRLFVFVKTKATEIHKQIIIRFEDMKILIVCRDQNSSRFSSCWFVCRFGSRTEERNGGKMKKSGHQVTLTTLIRHQRVAFNYRQRLHCPRILSRIWVSTFASNLTQQVWPLFGIRS